MNTTNEAQPLRKQRVEWVDYAKGIAIFFVVQVHILFGLKDSGMYFSEGFTHLMLGWKFFSFNMPVFFFISGLFLSRSVQKAFPIYFSDKLRTVVYPYFLWSIITLAVGTFAAGATNTEFSLTLETIVSLFARPIFQYWFLFALFPLTIIAALMSKRGMDIRWLIVPTAFMMILSIVGEIDSIWKDSILLYSIWLPIGVIFSPLVRNTLDSISTRNLVWVIMAMALVWGGLAFGDADLRVEWLRPIGLVFGTTMVFSISTLFARLDLFKPIKSLGKLSLEVYLAHIIFGSGIRVVLERLLNIDETWIHAIVGTIVAIGIPILLKIVCDRVGFNYAFTFPHRKQPQVNMNPLPAEAA